MSRQKSRFTPSARAFRLLCGAVGMLVMICAWAEPAAAQTLSHDQCQRFAEGFSDTAASPIALSMGMSLIDGQLAKLETDTEKTEADKATARTSLTYAKSEMVLAAAGEQGGLEDVIARCMAVEY